MTDDLSLITDHQSPAPAGTTKAPSQDGHCTSVPMKSGVAEMRWPQCGQGNLKGAAVTSGAIAGGGVTGSGGVTIGSGGGEGGRGTGAGAGRAAANSTKREA